jgi:peroxiredoxin
MDHIRGDGKMRRPVLIFLFLSIFWLLDVSLGNAQFFEAGVEKLENPVAAPDFNLKVLGNGTMGLKDLKGKVVFLTFIQDWCPVCKKDAASLDKLARDTRDKNVVFLLVAVKWRQNELVEFKKEYKISSPILIDNTGSVPHAYHIAGYPETFIINRQEKIVGRTFAKEKWNTAAMKNLFRHLLSTDQ